MVPRAIEQAESRFNKATEAFTRMKESKTFAEFEPAWSDFLLATGGIYSKLEQGAKSSAKSRHWFGIKKSERRKDELLEYMHQARNSDEHGIEAVVGSGGSRLSVGAPGESFRLHIKEFSEHVADYSVTPLSGSSHVTVEHEPIVAQLVSVRNSKFGDAFDPPSIHLGQRIDSREAKPAAALMLVYAAKMIDEAKQLPASE